jgi:tetratricopeptide (TPR) repeat protein
LFLFLGLLLMALSANSLYLAGVTLFEWLRGEIYQNYFYQFMFLGHLLLGFLLVAPLAVFIGLHFRNTRRRLNRRAVAWGYALAALCLLLVTSGLLLVRLEPFELRSPRWRWIIYWTHVACPLAVLLLYLAHRLAGRRIQWRRGAVFFGGLGAAAVVLVALHGLDPRRRHAVDAEGPGEFAPSLVRIAGGGTLAPETLMDDRYCQQCHADVHAQWSESVHRFSSFNNPVYTASVRETREVSMARDRNVHRARWCAGCHDPVPLFAGVFDDPDFDDIHHPTARAGITCTVCHAITEVHSTRGNADYTIEEPLHYPFARSENLLLGWLNRQLIRAKPEFHKKTFLRPLHRTSEFCSACHKVHLPEVVNDYKFLRGQNHYDTYLLSGVSGHGARSFYYPPEAKDRCASCHMPLVASGDFGAQYFDGAEALSVHNHLFVGANTGQAWLRGRQDIVEAHQKFLEGKVRVDLFGLREGRSVDAPLAAPLRPKLPALKPGGSYVLEVVVRTLGLGHPLTQGTVDSNELWLEVKAVSGGKTLGHSGARDERGAVDPGSHFVNVFLLDREGRRIERRNPQDIFVPLYDNQIPPGAAQTVHYGLELPASLPGPVEIEVQLQYRKFDAKLMDFVARTARPGAPALRGSEPGKPYVNQLPVTMLAADRVSLPLEGQAEPPAAAPKTPEWERWNDYGIGLLLKGRAQLRQAAEAFEQVERLGRFDGPVNLARVAFAEGRLDDATAALRRAAGHTEPKPPDWTVAWFSGLVNRQQGRLEAAEKDFRSVLEVRTAEMVERKFDFRLDYEVVNQLGETLFDRAKQSRGPDRAGERTTLLRQAAEQFERTLAIDTENVPAHYNLSLLYAQLGEPQKAREHRDLYARYKPDDNARDRAVALARQRYPDADRAAERVVIYRLIEPPKVASP